MSDAPDWGQGISVNSGLVKEVYRLARLHLPEPMRVDVTYWDDGTMTIRARHILRGNEQEQLVYNSGPVHPNEVVYQYGEKMPSGRWNVYEEEVVGTLDPDTGEMFSPESEEVEPASKGPWTRLKSWWG